MRRNAKIDNTHTAIVDCLRAMGYSVFSLASVGRGCPDVVLARGNRTYLAEIKNGKLGWKLTDAQKKFHQNWNASILVFDSVETVILWQKEEAA